MHFSLIEIWQSTGLFARIIIFTLAIMSISSLVVMAERMVVFRKTRADSRTFAAKMGAILAKGDLGTASETNLGKDVGHLGRVINSGLTAYKISRNNREVAVESVARALERQAAREVQSMKRGLGVLATVGSTAPFVGLLGTTMGIINAFQLMAESGSGGLGTISAGIAEALITTAFGLLVAIPAVMAYNFLQGWVDSRSVDISESSNEFLDVVARNMTGGASHSHQQSA
jgi:biopolymer transport protein ExbB/TolQ